MPEIAPRTAVFTLSVDLDRYCTTDDDIAYALDELAEAIVRRCVDLPHTGSDVQIDGQEVQVSAALDFGSSL